MTFTDEIRREIKRCGVSRYRISKKANVGQPALSKLMAGKGLGYAALDRVAKAIGLHVTRNPEIAARLARTATKPGRPAKK
jgi:predicted transcriptional regulator